MGATSTPTINDLIIALRQDFPNVSFIESNDFTWDPTTKAVYYSPSDGFARERLLHEVAHAQLGHTSFARDIDLIAMERDAWHVAKSEFGPRYNVALAHDIIHDDMDTYRDWMHSRSTCPNCQTNGIETAKQLYTCVSCREQWRVNEARSCGLRRTSIKK